MLFFCSLTPLDQTTVINANGVDVVDAALRKMSNVNSVSLQNDFRFLRRIALVESNFGALTSQNPNGGIWQVGLVVFRFEAVFHSTKR